MKSVTEASARRTIGAGLTEAKRRRRWPAALLWLVFVALVADAIGFMVYVSRYQPLSANTLASGVDDRQIAATFTAVSPAGQAFSQYRVGALRGKGMWYSFSLANAGRLPVTITSVAPSTAGGAAARAALDSTGVRVGPAGDPAATVAEATTFEPFSLDASGGARLVVIDARFDACRRTQRGPSEPPATYIGSIAIDYEVLGFYGRRTILPLPYTIEVPDDAGCGARSDGPRQGP